MKKKLSLPLFLVLACIVVLTSILGFSLFQDAFFSVIETNSTRKLEKQETTVESRATSSTSPGTPVSTPSPKIRTSSTEVLLELPLHTFQTFNNCGPATLAMNLSYYGYDLSQQTLGDQLRPYQVSSGDNDDKSVTLAELGAKAEELGLVSYYRPAGDIELLKTLTQNNIPVITRTWTAVDEDIGHYRVVTGFDEAEQVLYQDDSLQGEAIAFSYQDFNAVWQPFNYEFLVIAPQDNQAVVEAVLGNLTSEEFAWQQALALSERQLQKDENNTTARFNASVALYHLGRYQDSVAAYEASKVNLPPRTLWYRIEPLLAYYQLGEYQTVLTEIDRIVTSGNRAYSELYMIRGDMYLQQGELEAARREYQLAVEYNRYYQPAITALQELN